ncbi:diguanylate cyclase (GGDEF) domain-containing protein [Ferrimonas sediminum]|uniref:diguanylate cyclase n=1 Tax=Ferrimonas sediminum TaxID=718193 RepID=A0A1G8T902_9GAMM|nr:diguanylate cyclase [Ferrimonas sediminum]SDJ37891.1 diguanylate cyclase (GGDEF) domain-containing protein [Ferrimonas sediminum]
MGIPKILIVDDRPENLLTLEGLLEGFVVDLVRATSGEEALAHTLDHDFALILLDVQMPGMDGFEVAELMRGNRKTKHIPIIFVTASYKASEHIFKGYDSGAVDYLLKPLNSKVFRSKVGVFIELYQQKEALKDKTVEFDRKLVELEELQQQLEETNEQLLMLSTTDGLTGLLNRRRFDELLNEEWKRGSRTGRSLSLVLMDIDHFKAYNDTYGHQVGDDCLREVASTLMEIPLRVMDKTSRIGGEEFAVLLPETGRQGAMEVANRVRECVDRLQKPHHSSPTAGNVTISIGVASLVPALDDPARKLLELADIGLYRAKSLGRNRCCYHENEAVSAPKVAVDQT